MLPVKFWQPSAASLSHFSPSPSKESASVIEPLPVVILFIQSITASSCIISNLSYIYRWVTGVSWSSQVSSRAKEKKPKFSALLFNWNSRFTTMCSVHLVTEGCILKKFFSVHISTTEATRHSLINSPSENSFPFFVILWEVAKLVLTAPSLDVQSSVNKKSPCFFWSFASKHSDIHSCSASVKFLYFSMCSVS